MTLADIATLAYENGDVIVVTIDGTTKHITLPAAAATVTPGELRDAINAAFDGTPAALANGDADVVITGTAVNEAGEVSLSNTQITPVGSSMGTTADIDHPRSIDLDAVLVQVGATYMVSIGPDTFEYVANQGDTIGNIASALATQINAKGYTALVDAQNTAQINVTAGAGVSAIEMGVEPAATSAEHNTETTLYVMGAAGIFAAFAHEGNPQANKFDDVSEMHGTDTVVQLTGTIANTLDSLMDWEG